MDVVDGLVKKKNETKEQRRRGDGAIGTDATEECGSLKERRRIRFRRRRRRRTGTAFPKVATPDPADDPSERPLGKLRHSSTSTQ